MRVVFIVNNFPPTTDGVGDYTYILAKKMAEDGHDVTIICNSKIRKVNDLKFQNFAVFPVVVTWDTKGFNKAFHIIEQIQPDYISLQYVPYSYHEKGIPFRLIPIIYKLDRLSGCTLSIMFHEVSVQYRLSNPKTWILASLQRSIAFTISILADRILTSIQKYKKYLGGDLGRDIAVVPIGSNILSIPSVQEVAVVLSSFKIEGRFAVVFGIKDIVSLISFITDRRFDDLAIDKLVIIGKICDDIEKRILEVTKRNTSLSKRIVLTGALSENVMAALLSSATAMLDFDKGGVSAKSGTKAAAYHYGVPIVGFSGHITDRFYVDQVNVDFVCDVEEMYTRLMLLLQDEHYHHYRSKESTSFYQERLCWMNIHRFYEQEFSTMISEK